MPKIITRFIIPPVDPAAAAAIEKDRTLRHRCERELTEVIERYIAQGLDPSSVQYVTDCVSDWINEDLIPEDEKG